MGKPPDHYSGLITPVGAANAWTGVLLCLSEIRAGLRGMQQQPRSPLELFGESERRSEVMAETIGVHHE